MNLMHMKRNFPAIALLMLLCNQAVQASEISTMKDPFPRYGLDEQIQGSMSASSARVNQVLLPSPRSAANLFYRMKSLVGFEDKRSGSGEPQKQFEYSAVNLTLRQALDLLTSKDTDYVWEVSSGVINIHPRDSMLDIRIPQFTAKGVGIYGAASLLKRQLTQPGFEHAMDRVIEQGQSGHFGFYEANGPRINVDLVNPTLRQCLNEMIRQDGSHDWVASGTTAEFRVNFLPRARGVREVHKKAMEGRHKEFEEKSLREGFQKGKDGTWVKPGPGGKWGPVDSRKVKDGK